jgi:[acyl-carrier-protein] S-malonyltransferase
MTIAFVFPGQGSQAPQSGAGWADQPTWSLVHGASEATGADVARLLLEADAEELVDTANAQLSTYVVSLVASAALVHAGIRPVAMAGHSLGEYTALAAAGMVAPDAMARIVAARGMAMRQASVANPGTMAALLGLETDTVADLCEQVAADVWVANDNAPGQVVIAGSAEGIDQVGALAKEQGGRKPMPLKVAGAFHTPYMDPAQTTLDGALVGAPFVASDVTVWANVDAEPHTSPAVWPALLGLQLCSPVRWREEIAAMAASGVDTFVEVGPGTVLSGMIKRIAPDAARHSVATPADVADVVDKLG